MFKVAFPPIDFHLCFSCDVLHVCSLCLQAWWKPVHNDITLKFCDCCQHTSLKVLCWTSLRTEDIWSSIGNNNGRAWPLCCFMEFFYGRTLSRQCPQAFNKDMWICTINELQQLFALGQWKHTTDAFCDLLQFLLLWCLNTRTAHCTETGLDLTCVSITLFVGWTWCPWIYHSLLSWLSRPISGDGFHQGIVLCNPSSEVWGPSFWAWFCMIKTIWLCSLQINSRDRSQCIAGLKQQANMWMTLRLGPMPWGICMLAGTLS